MTNRQAAISAIFGGMKDKHIKSDYSKIWFITDILSDVEFYYKEWQKSHQTENEMWDMVRKCADKARQSEAKGLTVYQINDMDTKIHYVAFDKKYKQLFYCQGLDDYMYLFMLEEMKADSIDWGIPDEI